MRKLSAGRLELGLVAAGAALLATLILRVGPAAIAADIGLVGWGFLPILAAESPVVLFSAAGWWYAIEPARRKLSLLRLSLFRCAAEGVNHLTPTATIGGEFVRARMATPYLGAKEAASSVTLAKFTETAGQYVFVVVGLLLLFGEFESLRVYRPYLVMVLVPSVIGVFLLGLLLRRGLFSTGASVLGRISAIRRALENYGPHLSAIDSAIRESLERRPLDLAKSILLLGLSFATRAVEIWIILRLLGLPTSPAACVGIEVLSVLINSLFFFMPAKMGTQEGGKMLIFGLLGLPPEKGLVLGLVRRAREITWDLFGLLVYTMERRRSQAWAADAPPVGSDDV